MHPQRKAPPCQGGARDCFPGWSRIANTLATALAQQSAMPRLIALHVGAEAIADRQGVATVAAVRRATGLPVVAAMTAGNLPDIAEAIHAKRPDLTLIIAADDDAKGHEAARLASLRTGAQIALPGEFSHG